MFIFWQHFSLAFKDLRLEFRIGEAWCSTHWLVHTDLCWDEELLHGHHVHVGEVLDHKPLALVQVVVTSTNAVVLLKVDNVLSDHDRVLDVRLHPFKALDTLVAGVLLNSITSPSSLTNMDGSIHKVVLNNGKQHANIVS